MSDRTSISPNSTKKDITGKEEREENKKRRGPIGKGIQKIYKEQQEREKRKSKSL